MSQNKWFQEDIFNYAILSSNCVTCIDVAINACYAQHQCRIELVDILTQENGMCLWIVCIQFLVLYFYHVQKYTRTQIGWISLAVCVNLSRILQN